MIQNQALPGNSITIDHRIMIQRDAEGRGVPGPPWKSHAVGFVRNTGTDLPREAIGPDGSPSRSNWTPQVQLLLEGGPYGPL